MGIKKGIKQYLGFQTFLLALSKATEEKCESVGEDLANPTDKFFDKLFGGKNSEISQVRMIFKLRAFVRGFIRGLMKDMPQKLKDELNQFKKEV